MPPSCDVKQCCQSEVSTCLTKKLFFIFWMLKTCVFREAATRRVTPNGAIPCLSQSRPYFTDGRQKACISDPRSYSRQFRPPSADSAGTGWNLNCGSSIACPLFLPKMLLSFTCRHFITESTTYWHASNPSHGRPPRRNRPVFENTVKNSKKIKKMGDLRVTSSNVAYQLAKTLNLQYRRFLEKVFSKTTYHERRFMAFKPN